MSARNINHWCPTFTHAPPFQAPNNPTEYRIFPSLQMPINNPALCQENCFAGIWHGNEPLAPLLKNVHI